MASKYEQLFKQAQETQGPSIHTHPEYCFNNIDMSEIGWFDDLDMSCIKRLAQEAAKYSSSEQLLSTIKNR